MMALKPNKTLTSFRREQMRLAKDNLRAKRLAGLMLKKPVQLPVRH